MIAAPETLGEIGRQKWSETVSRLKRPEPNARVLTTLEVYCASYERWARAQKWLDEHGDVLEIVSDKGVVLKVQPAPKLDVAARAEKSMADAMKVLAPHLT